jgi:hypothetical protein
MHKLLGISAKKMSSICFLVAVLFITLSLGSLTFLINDNVATLPHVGLDGNYFQTEGLSNKEEETMKMNIDSMKENTNNVPNHSSKKTTK